MTPFIQSRRASGRITLFVLPLLLALTACERTAEEAAPPARPAVETTTQTSAEAVLARGELLVAMMDCDGCHTPFVEGAAPGVRDPSRRLSGHPQDVHLPPPPDLGDGPWQIAATGSMTAFYGPWGISFSANLTPDTTSGLGTWTESMFSRSMRTGRHWGTGREILPPMPWAAYSHMSDDDLHAMYVYLRSVPPVMNEVPPYTPPERVARAK